MRKLRVGLALGGGAARGAAHIGILKVLERENIPVHIITGTSIGAIIGAM
jgi:NTE family protein